MLKQEYNISEVPRPFGLLTHAEYVPVVELIDLWSRRTLGGTGDVEVSFTQRIMNNKMIGNIWKPELDRSLYAGNALVLEDDIPSGDTVESISQPTRRGNICFVQTVTGLYLHKCIVGA